MDNGFNDKEIDFALDKSEKICKKLNDVFDKEIAGLKDLQIGVAYYTVARFAAQFVHDVKPIMADGFSDSFKDTFDDILQAYEDEGPDKTGRLLKFVNSTES